MSNNSETKLVMLIDWQNINTYCYPNKVNLDSIIEQARTWGDLRHSIAFSGFEDKNGGMVRRLHSKSIEPRFTLTKQIKPKNGSRLRIRNAADIHLAVAAMSISHSSPGVSGFVIVSGDGGFLPLIRELKLLGNRVYVISPSPKSTQKALYQEVDGLAYYSEFGSEEE